MMILNQQIEIDTVEQLSDFCKILEDKSTTTEEKKVLKPLIDYLADCFFIDQKLRNLVAQEIEPDCYTIVYVDIFDDTDYNHLQIGLGGKTPTKRDLVILQQLSDDVLKDKQSFTHRLQNTL